MLLPPCVALSSLSRSHARSRCHSRKQRPYPPTIEFPLRLLATRYRRWPFQCYLLHGGELLLLLRWPFLAQNSPVSEDWLLRAYLLRLRYPCRILLEWPRRP